ncbi:hypothetical protein SAMN05421677_11594 [Halobacillus aidingensis]|uniref:Uncharacterized protein n=2 Tax=Halobacillus aidingensis TaxID=240303 RepID=A0A1H0RL83_HALAD|nr:hypothetical protein SAMN05421677_11594 [Halobacillus aidingensis]
MFDPEDLQVIKAKIDLYKATIESLKAEHQAYQELLFQHDHKEKKEEVIPLNENEYEEEYMEDEEAEAYDYFSEQFGYLHESINELGSEMLSLNEKFDLLLMKQEELMENNDLKGLREDIAELKKAIQQPKAAPAAPVDQTPKGFSQLRNMVRPGTQVHDPNDQGKFQGPRNHHPSPTRSQSPKSPSGLPRGHKPLSSSKKNKTVKSNKMNPQKKKKPASNPPIPKDPTIQRSDDPDASTQQAVTAQNNQALNPPVPHEESKENHPFMDETPENKMAEQPAKDQPAPSEESVAMNEKKEAPQVEETKAETKTTQENIHEENDYKASIEEKSEDEKAEKRQPVNAFFSLFQRG